MYKIVSAKHPPSHNNYGQVRILVCLLEKRLLNRPHFVNTFCFISNNFTIDGELLYYDLHGDEFKNHFNIKKGYYVINTRK